MREFFTTIPALQEILGKSSILSEHILKSSTIAYENINITGKGNYINSHRIL